MSEEPPRSCLEPRLVFAAGNTHKISRLEVILAPAWQGYAPGAIAYMSDFNAPAPLRDGTTLEGNSLVRARVLVESTGLPVFADDSGICINIIGGAPGIPSARWCGAHRDGAINLDLLLAQLVDVPGAHRGAALVSAAALVLPDGREFVERGEVRGTLTRECRGGGGFGYDPIFVPEGYSHTSAELSPEEKNAISHRGKIFRALFLTTIEALKGK